MSRKKKILIVIACEIVVYFLVYLVEPFMISYLGIGGSLFYGGWLFNDTLGAYVNLIVVPLFTIIAMNFWVDEFKYWLTWIPVYIIMKFIYYPEGVYIDWFGLDDFVVDFAFPVIIVIQILCWIIVKLKKLIKKKINKRKMAL